jgi:hypothetical protein
MLKFSGKLNHFALRAKIYISAFAYRFRRTAKITAFENYRVTPNYKKKNLSVSRIRPPIFKTLLIGKSLSLKLRQWTACSIALFLL